jgi:hypothetical protein
MKSSFSLHPSVVILLSSFFLLISACAPTATPLAPATKAPSGTVLFKDEFDANTTGWDRFSNEGGIMDYFEGHYRMLVQRPDLNFWSTPHKNFSDVRVEADVTTLAGPKENRIGLMCRYQHGNYYFFIISNDGYYAIGKFINNQATLLGQEEMQASTAILSDAANHLQADCVGNTLTFTVNKTQIATVQDRDLQSGDIGVLAGTFSQPGVDVAFDHFVVTQP